MINKVKYKKRSSFVSVPRDCDFAMAVAITQWRGNAPECPIMGIVLNKTKSQAVFRCFSFFSGVALKALISRLSINTVHLLQQSYMP